MDPHVAAIIPYATAVALSPMPVAALILMLLSKKAKANSVAFTIGWIVGLAALVFFVKYLVAIFAGDVHRTTGFSVEVLIHYVLGIILILFAIKEWKMRPKKGQTPKMPKWMGAIATFTPVKALIIGFLLATLNLKNTPMGITVGAVISDAGSHAMTVLIVYLILASSTITIPTVGFLLFGKKLERTLESLRSWLVSNNATIMFILFLVLGVVLLSKALGGN